MKKIYEIHNGENVLTVDCENKKMYFNGINDGKTVDHIRIEKYGEF